MKLTLHTFLSIDGVMQGPGGVDEDTSGGFERGGWLVPYADEVFGEIVDGWFANADAILLGRTTYTMMQEYWSKVTDPDNHVAVALNTLPKHIATSSPLQPEWNNSTALTGDVVAQVRELKNAPGRELQVHGSWQLAQTLHQAGLIDEYRLLTFPVYVGDGKRLFPEGGAPSGFSVVDTRITGTGATYTALTPTPFSVGYVGPVTNGQEA